MNPKKTAIERGGRYQDKVYVVRSGLNLERLKIPPWKEELKMGAKYLVGNVG